MIVNGSRFPKTSAFTRAFAAEYKAFMVSAGIRGADIASVLDRGEGYVSERVNGKRPLDTDDVDALASLVEGWNGIDLMIELSRRARNRGNVIRAEFGVGDSIDDQQAAVARPTDPDSGEDQ